MTSWGASAPGKRWAVTTLGGGCQDASPSLSNPPTPPVGYSLEFSLPVSWLLRWHSTEKEHETTGTPWRAKKGSTFEVARTTNRGNSRMFASSRGDRGLASLACHRAWWLLVLKVILEPSVRKGLPCCWIRNLYIPGLFKVNTGLTFLPQISYSFWPFWNFGP